MPFLASQQPTSRVHVTHLEYVPWGRFYALSSSAGLIRIATAPVSTSPNFRAFDSLKWVEVMVSHHSARFSRTSPG